MEENLQTSEKPNYASFDYDVEHRKSIYSILVYAIAMYVASVIVQLALMIIAPTITGYALYFENDLGELIIQPDNEIFINSWSQFLIYLIMFVGLIIINYQSLIKHCMWFVHDFKKQIVNVIMGIGIFFVAMIVSSIFLTLLDITDSAENQVQIEKMLSGDYAIIVIIAIVILGPICEELIYRKSFFGMFSKDAKTWVKVVVSGLIFGFIHVGTTMLGYLLTGENILVILKEFLLGIPYMLQGIALSYVYYKSDENILPVIIIHILNNLYATIVVMML